MKPDENTQRIKPVEDHDESPNIEREHESEAAEVQEPQPTGWAAQLRQLMHGSAQGEARTKIKRQQLREDRTKSFLLLAGLTVVLALAFFVMFSTPSTGRKDVARTNQPNLGRGFLDAQQADTLARPLFRLGHSCILTQHCRTRECWLRRAGAPRRTATVPRPYRADEEVGARAAEPPRGLDGAPSP